MSLRPPSLAAAQGHSARGDEDQGLRGASDMGGIKAVFMVEGWMTKVWFMKLVFAALC